MKRGFHILREGDTLTLARHLPPRFDVFAETRVPRVGRLRLVHQVRQDLWRLLQNLRGFSPVVSARLDGQEIALKAGGRLFAACNRSQTRLLIQGLLNDSAHLHRWITNSRRSEYQASEARP